MRLWRNEAGVEDETRETFLALAPVNSRASRRDQDWISDIRRTEQQDTEMRGDELPRCPDNTTRTKISTHTSR